ncbi:hypothetical protein ACSBR1_003972 [Camellia fascicularis]
MEHGRNGSWIPVVNQRRGGGSRGYEARNGLYTVFVDNIPRSLDANSLFKLFKKFGVVKDVFIPFKRRKATNSRFGFVRFDCHVASDIAIQKANGLLVDDKVLAVKYATHDRSVPSMRRPQANREAFYPIRGTGSIPYTVHKSFAEVLQRGMTMAAVKASITVKVNEDGHGWLYESVIIRLNSDFSINSIRFALKDNRNTLNNIGALWRSVFHLEGDLSQPKSFSYSRIKVVTTCMELINKTINLECKGKLHPVFVCEDHSVNPMECHELSNIGLGDCNTSSNVVLSRAEGNVFTDGGCKRKDKVDTVANRHD